jgi:hypothetical protein
MPLLLSKDKARNEDEIDDVDEDAESDGDGSPADLGHVGSPIEGLGGDDEDMETLDRHTVRPCLVRLRFARLFHIKKFVSYKLCVVYKHMQILRNI